MQSIRNPDLFDVSTIDVTYRAGPRMRPVRVHNSRMNRAVRRFAYALLPSMGLVMTTTFLVAIAILTFWIASADAVSSNHASSPAWSPASTILLDRGR